jgi:23S rRNA pseudouridine1911/1915/1917 synthase
MMLCSDDGPSAVTQPLRFSYQIIEKQAGERLDQFLARKQPELSRSQLSASIRAGQILVDGICKKSSYRLKSGDMVEGEILSLAAPVVVQPEKIEFSILYEDEFLLVISKPPGLVVHPGSGNRSGTLVNGLVHHCASIAGVGDSIRPGIVHRLDKDTSGVMVVAKRENVHRLLVDAFKARAMGKEYVALLHGIFKQKTGRLVAPIGRHPVHRQKMAIREMGGRYAATQWRVEDEFMEKYSLTRIDIETGRTHQIRVHMASLGHPVVGDDMYGGGRFCDGIPRQLLHASRLRCVHPVTGQELDIEAPLWPDFLSVLHALSDNSL